MSCLLLLVKDKIAESGGSSIPLSVVMTTDEFNVRKDELKNMILSGGFSLRTEPSLHEIFDHNITITVEKFKKTFLNDFKNMTPSEQKELLHSIGNISDKSISLANIMAENGYMFSMDEITELNNPYSLFSESTIAHSMASHGYDFTIDELLYLENPCDANKTTVAHEMVRRKNNPHKFSTDELIKLKNPADRYKRTVAHYMVWNGESFSIEDLLKLDNPADCDGETLAHTMASSLPYTFSIDDLVRLNNPKDKEGNTVAHRMVQQGHKFSFSEIRKLMNPADRLGNTLMHVMAEDGYKFTIDELLEYGQTKNYRGLTVAETMMNYSRYTSFNYEEMKLLGID